MTNWKGDVIKVGDLVKFARSLYPIKKKGDCGIWLWRVGIVIKVDNNNCEAVVLSEGTLHKTSNRLIKVNSEKTKTNRG